MSRGAGKLRDQKQNHINFILYLYIWKAIVILYPLLGVEILIKLMGLF